jgi:hypothetical protein
MAVGRRKSARQEELWVSTSELARSASHPFYERVNRLLADAGFDAFVEERCAKFYADEFGRPSLPPSVVRADAPRPLLRRHRVGARHRLALP